jgi:hypothetical protein
MVLLSFVNLFSVVIGSVVCFCHLHNQSNEQGGRMLGETTNVSKEFRL